MIAKKFALIFLFASMAPFANLFAIVPAPDELGTESDMAGMMIPATDATTVPDATASPVAPDQTTGAQPATPEIQPEQMKGEDVLELSEEKSVDLISSGNPQIPQIFNQTKELDTQANQATELLAQQAKQLREQFNQLQIELDAFYQTAGAQQGKITKILEEITQPPTSTIPTAPALGQPITPTPALPMIPGM